MFSHVGFFTFLRHYDLVYLVLEKEPLLQAQQILSLQLLCKEAKATMSAYLLQRQYRQRDIVNYILTGYDDPHQARYSVGHVPSGCLYLPLTSPLGFSLPWRQMWSAKLSVVDLSSLSTYGCGQMSITDLPLNIKGILFPNARSLSVGEVWGDAGGGFSETLHFVAQSCLPSRNLRELSIHGLLTDAIPILTRAALGTPLESLSFISLGAGIYGDVTSNRLEAVRLIGHFSWLRVLNVPSALFHRNTADVFASLPFLEVLWLTSTLAANRAWCDELVPGRDDWDGVGLIAEGFSRLRHLVFENTPPDQLTELARSECMLGAINTLTLRSSNACIRYGGADEYVSAFRSLSRVCQRLQHLNLGLPSLDPTLLRPLAGISLTTCNLLPVDPQHPVGFQDIVEDIWPSAEILTGGYDMEL